MQSKTSIDPAALRAEIRALGPWHHDIEIAPGIRTGEAIPPDTYPPELGTPSVIDPSPLIDHLVDGIYGEDFAGRTVLDCACNAGGYLFAAARRGAGPSFGFDVREHWIRQAHFLQRQLGVDSVQFEVRDVLTLAERGLPQFDVSLFMGIFYHLPDPMTGLKAVADQTRELLVLNTAIQPEKRDALILNTEDVTEVMSGVHRLAWLPTSEKVLRAILEWCGFPHVRVASFTRPGKWKARIHVMAARDPHIFERYDTRQSTRPKTLFGRLLHWW